MEIISLGKGNREEIFKPHQHGKTASFHFFLSYRVQDESQRQSQGRSRPGTFRSEWGRRRQNLLFSPRDILLRLSSATNGRHDPEISFERPCQRTIHGKVPSVDYL